MTEQARSDKGGGGSTGSIEPPSAASSTCIHVTVVVYSCKLPKVSVKIQLNLHQNEPFQVKNTKIFWGGAVTLPRTPSYWQLVPETPAVRRRR